MTHPKPQPALIHHLSPNKQAVIGRHGAIILEGNHTVSRLNPRELDNLARAWHTHRNPTTEEAP